MAKCELCGGATPSGRASWRDPRTKKELKLCSSCGFVYSNNKNTFEWMAQIVMDIRSEVSKQVQAQLVALSAQWRLERAGEDKAYIREEVQRILWMDK